MKPTFISSVYFWSQIIASLPKVAAVNQISDFTPKAFIAGTEVQWPKNLSTALVLDTKSPIATIDYGSEVAGYPFFEIGALNGPVQIEVKYSEPYDGLHQPWSDGPYTFSTSLANGFRVETFNITKTGMLKSPLIQGGQRWQSVRLIAGHSLTFTRLGFVSTVSDTDPKKYPSQFHSDNELFNEIWKLGAKAASFACVEKGTQVPAVKIDPVKGAFFQSTRSSPNVETSKLENYTLEFEASIERAGLWWTVAQPLTYGSGLQLLLTGELPQEKTFANANKSLTPANSILLSKGYDFVNQTTLDAYLLDTFTVPFTVHEKEWYNITTILSDGDRISVHINGTQVFDVSLGDYYTGGSEVSLSGAFGFGAYQDHSAWVRNAMVYDSKNGTFLYKDSLRDHDASAKYGYQANLATVCLDGPKRDRLVWLGDFYHTSRIIGASSSRYDWTRGTLSFLLDTQVHNGELNMSPSMGYDPSTTIDAFSEGGKYPALEDYQMLGFLAFYHFIRQSGDLRYASDTWPQWQKQLEWLLSTVNATDGLVDLTSAFVGDSSGGAAVSCLAVETLNGAAKIASALGQSNEEKIYIRSARSLAQSINKYLWNDHLGTYSASRSSQQKFGVSDLAWCITSGVANSTQTSEMLSSKVLGKLKLGPGYKADTTVSASDPSASISPNTNGFLLPALFMGNATATARDLLVSVWGPMLPAKEGLAVGNDTTATGTSWEYLSVDGSPGLGLFTSLSHPWGGAATYILTEWATGLRPFDGPEGFGYNKWLLEPQTGIEMGLKKSSAKVVTTSGDILSVSWELKGKSLSLKIDAPPGTTGTVRFHGISKDFRGGKKQSATLPVQRKAHMGVAF
ncbi:uncharacterized protein N7469_010491 [Penicillium citrinum]|uniref:Alpha-L-rhamnosidase six-hairpin glycosidase domain-containing protein n=1 Tax=Penicillium citrinum TaxID=5077 RepID=A0A9W9NMY8_PENCI|nr:uncharacterized protein N7469_010491 [Penicillium citrinum]KAJ5221604.1 hypothetical protein N7469_010491 [Penicillium citrinum]